MAAACKAKCQICGKSIHLADACPYLYTTCKIPGCYGIRKLGTAHTTANDGRKFLKCQFSTCSGFQWLEDAILEDNNIGASSSTSAGCHDCGALDHWRRDCPWNSSPCNKKNCQGIRSVHTSGSKENPKKKYLKCSVCKGFEWLCEAQLVAQLGRERRNAPVEIVVKTNLDDLCDKLGYQMRF